MVIFSGELLPIINKSRKRTCRMMFYSKYFFKKVPNYELPLLKLLVFKQVMY